MTTEQTRQASSEALQQDPVFRQEVVQESLDRAAAKGMGVGTRIKSLLDQYAAGELSWEELEREIMRPFQH